MNRGIGFRPRLRKMRKTCGLRQTLKCCGSSSSTITSGRTMGSPLVCVNYNTCENITARVCFCRSEFTGLTATRMTRGDELPRHLIPESGWPRFLQATVAEWTAILDTSAVTNVSPAAAKDIRKHLSHRIVPSRHVYREKSGEGVGAASVVCSWNIVNRMYASLNDLLQHHKRPQFTLSCLLQQSSNVKFKSAFMQSDKDLSERPRGKLYASLLPGGIPLADGTWFEEGSLVQLNAAAYGLVTGGRRLCVALRALATEGHATTPAHSA